MSNEIVLSVVVPLYNEELVIKEMYSRLIALFEAHAINYELILVNDGSQDKTLVLAEEIGKNNEKVKIISFSRNFGHQFAITAGMDKCRGQAVVVIDADLQDPPEIILDMMEKWKEGYDVVYGVRKKRDGESIFKRFSAALFYRVLRRMTQVDIPVDTGDFRLIDRKVLEKLKDMRERDRFVRGMVSWVGFKQCKVEYDRDKRFAGETKYPFKKMLKFASDGILSFSQIPLRISTVFGLLCSLLSFVMMGYGFIIRIYFPDRAIPGWASLFIASLFLGGVQLICLGIIGEYIGRIFQEIKKRPLYIIDKEINFKE